MQAGHRQPQLYRLTDKVKEEATKTREAPGRQPLGRSIPLQKTNPALPWGRSPSGSPHTLMLEARVDMLSSNMIISGPAADLGAKEATRSLKKNPGPSARARAQPQPLSIKDKISKWEGKKELPTSDPPRQTDGQEDCLPSCRVERRGSELTRIKNGMRPETESLQNDSRARSVCQDTERLPGLRQNDGQPEPSQHRGRELKPSDLRFQSDHLSVLRQVKRLEKALKDGSAGLDPQLPGTCYSPHCLPDKTEEDQPNPESHESGGALAAGRRAHHLEVREPGPENSEDWKGQESVYRGSRWYPPKPFINPVPKPRRTFRHAGEGDKDVSPGVSFKKEKRNLPPLPSLPPPPPPLPSSPPPTSVNRRLWTGRQRPSADHR